MNRIDLISMIKEEEISKTGAKPKLPVKIAGISEENLFVYRVPLEYLYYNNENGRIASAISRLDQELQPAYDNENPEYNDLIEKMIVEDNLSALKQTKNSIKKNGQKVFGYVLSDGRVIDGNRRFTALRQLSRESGTSQFFEAVILPVTYDSKASRAEIKRLELAIQMGIEERESYDPVDLAVDIYQTIITNKLMTEQDYAREANLSPRGVSIKISAVELIHDFLKFVNAKEHAYHIIKDAKLYNSLEELSKKLNKQFPKKGPKYEEAKIASFSVLMKILATGGQTVHELRPFYEILSSSSMDEFIEGTEDAIEEMRDNLESQEIKTVTDLRIAIESSTPEIRQINETFIQVKNKQNRGKNVQEFMGQVKDAKELFEDIRQGNGLTGSLRYSNFSHDQIRDIREMLIKINIASKELIDIYEDEL
ncbi:hypothetical protein [Erysipelothrix rhusiopathiae]|uniref:hypothetical protein n=1 Tax=Erysipelothrix rhusiopathiae TaxID=1648 RepID=UPI000F4336BA|nr:hypothetical protein [Erysipelothrix rhusiopathiae]AYV35232.1 hypothetical protein EEY85_07995 [Erysipelothrix rhusiopathiae]